MLQFTLQFCKFSWVLSGNVLFFIRIERQIVQLIVALVRGFAKMHQLPLTFAHCQLPRRAPIQDPLIQFFTRENRSKIHTFDVHIRRDVDKGQNRIGSDLDGMFRVFIARRTAAMQNAFISAASGASGIAGRDGARLDIGKLIRHRRD